MILLIDDLGVTPKRGRAFRFKSSLPKGRCGLSSTIANANIKSMKHFITTSKVAASSNFVIETILFSSQVYRFNSDNLIYSGIKITLVAVIDNTISFLWLLFNLLKDK